MHDNQGNAPVGTISMTTAILMTMNIMIGTAVYGLPHQMAAIAGNASFLSWTIAGLMLLPAVMCISRLSQIVPSSNGFFMYSYQAMGRLPGYIVGMIYMSGYIFASTAILHMFRQAVLKLVPAFTLANNSFQFFALFMMIIFLLNILSVGVIARIQDKLTIIKFSPILLAFLFFPFAIDSGFHITMPEFLSLPQTLSLGLFGFFGFEFTCNIGHHLKNKADGARAIMIGFLSVVACKTLFHFAVLHIMGVENLINMSASSFTKFLPFLSSDFKGYVVGVASYLIFISFFSSANGITLLVSSMLSSMSNNGLVRGASVLSQTNAYSRPWVILLIQCTFITAMGTCFTNVKQLADMTVTALFLTYWITVLALCIIEYQRKSSAWNLNFARVSFVITFGVLVFFLNAAVPAPLTTLSILAGCVMFGLLFYKPEEPAEIHTTLNS